MAKKNKSGQIDFFRSMAVLGVVVIGCLLYAFLNSAPRLHDSEYHKNSISAKECLYCHLRNVAKNPIMPHRPMDNCGFCHRPARSN